MTRGYQGLCLPGVVMGARFTSQNKRDNIHGSSLESQNRRLPPSLYRVMLPGFFKPFFLPGLILWPDVEGKHFDSWAFGEGFVCWRVTGVLRTSGCPERGASFVHEGISSLISCDVPVAVWELGYEREQVRGSPPGSAVSWGSWVYAQRSTVRAMLRVK